MPECPEVADLLFFASYIARIVNVKLVTKLSQSSVSRIFGGSHEN